jgi:hypothetical protein
MNVASPITGERYFVVSEFIVLNELIGGLTSPAPTAISLILALKAPPVVVMGDAVC